MDEDRAFYNLRQLPFWSEHAFIPQILDAAEAEPGNPDINYEYGRKLNFAVDFEHSSLLAERRFQNLLVERAVVLTNILTIGFANLEEDLAETIDLLNEELMR
jgi:hypothetical protein